MLAARWAAAALLGSLALGGCGTSGDGSSTPTAAQSALPGSSEPATPSARPTSAPTGADRPASEVVGRVPQGLVPEVSGVDVGAQVDGLWVVDDEPGTDTVHLVGLDGKLLGSVRLLGVDTVNVEDLAVGPCPGDGAGSCVHVADLGDNVAAREDVVVLSFPESAVDDGEVEPQVRRLTWPTPRDAEAVAVTDDGTLVVVDRTPDAAGVHLAGPGQTELRQVGTIELPAPRRPLLELFAGRVVTAADLREDGAALLLRTYDQLLELTPTDPDAPLDPSAIPSWAVAELPAPRGEPQGEAAAYLDAAGDQVVTLSESSTAVRVTTLRP